MSSYARNGTVSIISCILFSIEVKKKGLIMMISLIIKIETNHDKHGSKSRKRSNFARYNKSHIPHIIFTTKLLANFDVKMIRKISKTGITTITL